MQWSSQTVASKIITVTITPAATQRVIIGSIVGCAVLYATPAIPGFLLTATPIVKSGGTYTFKKGNTGPHASTTSMSPTIEWVSADASNLDFCLVGAVGQEITVTMDGSVLGTWTDASDGTTGVLTVFGWLDGRTGGGTTTSEKI